MSQEFLQFLSTKNQKIIKELNTPELVQTFVDQKVIYDPDREDRTIEEILDDGQGECYNGALLAATCLMVANFEVSLVRIEARGGDEEHILCVYKQNGYFGSIAQSKFLGLKGRKPIYRTVRDLVVSYQEFYFGFDGKYTLLAFHQPISLENYQYAWLNDRQSVLQIAEDLKVSPVEEIVKLDDPYFFVDPKRYWNEILYIPKWAKIPEKYLKAKTKKA